MIENTSDRDPLLQLAILWGDPGRGIAEMEKAGQQQLLQSDRLPVNTHGMDAEFLQAGFVFGLPDPQDPLFRPARLPDGWRREARGHDMWSYLVDTFGRSRVSVFYKAAFYDRAAFMRWTTVDAYAWTLVNEDVAPVLDDVWCTREALLAALGKMRDRNVEDYGMPNEELARIDVLIAEVTL